MTLQPGTDPDPPPGKAPHCPRCPRRHDPALKCWWGRYARASTALVLATYGTTCALCHLPGATTADHIRPRAWWGTDALNNLQPAHLSCNRKRRDRVTVGWNAGRPTTSRPW